MFSYLNINSIRTKFKFKLLDNTNTIPFDLDLMEEK